MFLPEVSSYRMGTENTKAVIGTLKQTPQYIDKICPHNDTLE